MYALMQNMYGQPMQYAGMPIAPQYGFMPASPTQQGMEHVGGGGPMYGAYPPPPPSGVGMGPHVMQVSGLTA